MNPVCFVLVHGAWHDAACWNHLVPLLEQFGHEVHCPDLPGHGGNIQDPERITLAAYCDSLVAYIEKIDTEVVLVGHSMSGMVISQVAETLPDKIRRLVYLCAYLPCHQQCLFDVIALNSKQENPAPVEAVMLMSENKRTCSITSEAIAPLFYNRCPDNLASAIPATFPVQATLPLTGKVSLSEQRFGQVAKTYICCLDDQVIPIKHQRRMLTRQACEEMIQLDADHSPFLSSPDMLAAIFNSSCAES